MLILVKKKDQDSRSMSNEEVKKGRKQISPKKGEEKNNEKKGDEIQTLMTSGTGPWLLYGWETSFH